jgi:hypothetical protein
MMRDSGAEVTAVSSGADYVVPDPVGGSIPTEELARRQGVRPIASVDELARDDVFESDQELDEFLAFVTAMRHSDVA